MSVATAISSALLRKPVKKNLAMTGEITLRGRVLPIGGLKEKIIAAHRGGISKVLIPLDNRKDIEEIPSKILKKVQLIPIENMDEVLEEALKTEKGEDIFLPNDRFQPFVLPKEESQPTVVAH